MEKYIAYLLPTICFFVLLSFSCNTQKQITETKTLAPPSELVAVFSKCTEAVALFEFDGADFKLVKEIANFDQDTFRFKVSHSDSRFYYVGTRSGRKRPVVLGGGKEVMVVGNCNNARQAKFKNSEVNSGYDELLQTFTKWNGATRTAGMQLQNAGNNQAKMQAAIEELAKIDQEKLEKINALKVSQPYLAKVAVLNTYFSFQNNNKGRYENEVEYFGKAFFDQANLGDKDYDHIPYLFEAFKNWSKVLAQQQVPAPYLQSIMDTTLAAIPTNGRAMKYALGGIVNSLEASSHALFEEYGNRYLALFEDQNHPALKAMRKKVDMAGSFVVGAVAPDFSQKTPEGELMSLSDLRGKVVLVDFWASWCGPCRRENPNVIKVYEKYKDKGFDVLGVSLDRSKAPWLKAIKKDKLPWHQISDLKGWKNEVAQLYSVSTIPQTVLLDREGRILARNLRGEALEVELAKIFND